MPYLSTYFWPYFSGLDFSLFIFHPLLYFPLIDNKEDRLFASRQKIMLFSWFLAWSSHRFVTSVPLRHLGRSAACSSFYRSLRSIGPIYTEDGSSVWDELGQRTIARLIILLCINTGKQTDHPFARAIAIVRLVRRTIVDNTSRRVIRLLFRIYTQTDYQKSYRSLPKLVPDGWPVSSINRAFNGNNSRAF